VFWSELRWLPAFALLGFLTTSIGAGMLHLPRTWLVLVLAAGVGMIAKWYFHAHGIDPGTMLADRWRWAIIRGMALGAILIVLVLPGDPTPSPEGTRLVFNIAWLGIVYGVADAMLLNVLPMMAMWNALTRAGLLRSWKSRTIGGMLAVVANLFVTAAYHLGYPEFRVTGVWASLTGPLGGNFFIGVGYLFAPNPIASLLGHIILHIAAVLGGADGTVQLPPHY
jgi:hypothetical protein